MHTQPLFRCRAKEAAVSSVCRFAVFAVASTFLVGAAPTAAPNPPPTPEQINRWVQQLGDKDFDQRQEASKRLWEAGETAEKALTAATKSDDAEVRRRATEILDKFKWGIFPETPKGVVDLIKRYQSAENPAKAELIRD